VKDGDPFHEAARRPAKSRHLRESVSNWSLRLRLGVFFAVFLVAAWLAAALFTWVGNRVYIDRFFDTQQTNFAKMLLIAGLDAPPRDLPKTGSMLHGLDKSMRGEQDKNAIGFALFDKDGVPVLHDGENGKHFIYDGQARGFADAIIGNGKAWRLFWLASPEGERIVAVGQEVKYRERLVRASLVRQMLPWFFLVPVLLAGLLWMLSRELAPLSEMSGRLVTRSPQDCRPLETAGIPPEVRPFVKALNGLFGRLADMRRRERAFVADAAHELRTPLAGLRVQSEVAELSDADPAARRHALKQMRASLDRCGRLVEQLLTLSRLESLLDGTAGGGEEGGFSFAPLDWPALLEETLQEFRPKAEDKGIALECTVRTIPANSRGAPSLVAILLRNLLDNAVRYTPDGGDIGITLDSHALVIENSGPGVSEACLPRLGERFFRPPGQEVSGSGLGLSIAKQLAGLHGFTLNLQNRAASVSGGVSGFVACLILLRPPEAPQGNP